MTPTLTASCAPAPVVRPVTRKIAAAVILLANWLMSFLRCGSQPASACLEPWNDLARDRLNLIHLVFVGNEDQLLRTDRQMRLELLDAFVDRSHNGAVLGRIAPGREVPFLG